MKCSLYLLFQGVGLDATCKGQGKLVDIDRRLRELDRGVNSSAYGKRLLSLQGELAQFCQTVLGKDGIHEASPMDIRRFLVWKECTGKTVVHDVACPGLGSTKDVSCVCRRGISFGTCMTLIGQLRSIFSSIGKGSTWDAIGMKGNPAAHKSVSDHAKSLKREQSTAHVSQKQAKPMWVDKLTILCEYLSNELESSRLGVTDKFIGIKLSSKFSSFLAVGRLIYANN